MEQEIIFGVLGVFLGYILYKYMIFKKGQQQELFSDILDKDEYKVKGRHDYLKEL